MRILIVHASAGAGHFKAAESIYDGIKAHTDYDAKLIDALDYTSPFFKKMYRGSYFFLISKVPSLWAFAFAILDFSFLQWIIRKFRRVYNFANGQKFQKFLIKENFDYIISTHFMPNEVASSLKRKKLITSKIISAVTDYDVHRIWTADFVDTYAVGCDWTKKKLLRIGIDESKIIVTGIPTNEKFTSEKDIGELKRKLEIKEDVFTVLIATGSFGIGPIEEIIEASSGLQIIVVCGHNQSLFSSLSSNKKELVRVFGLVDNMHEIMAVSDIMVTKPGGLSISEALVSKLPMIFFNPIPGQETNNIKVLREYGIGISDCSIEQIIEELNKMKSSKEIFSDAVEKTKNLAHPNAVKDIISLLN